MDRVKLRENARAAYRALDPQRISDPQLRDYFSRRWNWLALLAAVAMMAITWPVLGVTLRVPAYVLPVLALASAAPLLGIAAGRVAVRAGWVLIVAVCVVTSLLPRETGHDELRVAVPQFLVLLALIVASLLTQTLVKVPVVWLVSALTLLVAVPLDAALGWIFGLTVLAIGIAFLRYSVRSRRELAEKTEETELAQARQEVLAERTRIARELHDVVAHRMSMVVVMAQTARYRLAAAEPPEEMTPAVVTEFEAIAAAARESLDEVRVLLGVLRTEDMSAPHGPDGHRVDPSTAPLQPAPAAGDLTELVDSARAAGADVELDLRLDPAAVGAAAGLVVYRIVQESLSNAVRHAPGAPILVTVEPVTGADRAAAAGGEPDGIEPDGPAVRVSVVNDPPVHPPAPAAADRCAGFGIRGMTERAAALGGQLTAHAAAAGGFSVVALVPDVAGVHDVAGGAGT